MSDAPHPAVERVRAKALALWRPGNRYSIATDPNTFAALKPEALAAGRKPAVLIAIATEKESIVLAMDVDDWLDPAELAAVMIMEFVGFEPATVDAYDAAVEARAAVKK